MGDVLLSPFFYAGDSTPCPACRIEERPSGGKDKGCAVAVNNPETCSKEIMTEISGKPIPDYAISDIYTRDNWRFL